MQNLLEKRDLSQIEELKDEEIEENEYTSKVLIKQLGNNPIELVRKSQRYQYGNYDKYYSYRSKEKWQDSRITVFKKEYFLNKECLDIGCNDGSLTLMLAIRFFPKNIIGVDIDYALINKAIDNFKSLEKTHHNKNILEIQKNNLNNKKNEEINLNINPINEEKKINCEKTDLKKKNEEIQELLLKMKDFPKSFNINMGISQNLMNQITEIPEILEFSENDKKEKIENRFPNNISFRIENYIQDLITKERFDTIICLSTTKWIHLNWGDTGIRRLFKKIYDSLKFGGIFILEPQEWKSYKKKKYLNKEFKKTYKEIKLKPKDFGNYLEKIGFKYKEKMIPDINLKHLTFKRPIFVYEK